MVDTTVQTYNGATELRGDCAFIRGKYYHKTRDCFFYEGIYYSPFSRYLVIDHETNERVHSSSRELSFGIIGVEGSKYILGHFSSNISKNGSVYLSSKIDDEEFSNIMTRVQENNSIIYSEGRPQASDSPRRSLSERLLQDQDFSIRSEEYSSSRDPKIIKDRLVKCMDVRAFKHLDQCMNADRLCAHEDIGLYNKTYPMKFNTISAYSQYNFNLAYNSEVMMNQFQKAFNAEEHALTPKINNLAKYINDKTFGIEYESWDGRLPTYVAANNGLIPVRDGSLRHDGICGFEYASVIMNGAKGLSGIKSQCTELKKYAVFNEKCSMHIHVGNIPRTKENLVRLYKAFHTIQDSLYSLFPSCLENTGAYKQKDYCSRLPNIPFNANDIVEWLSDGKESFKLFGKPHPNDTSMQSKWNVRSRYSICNLNNFYYTNRGTVELRVSTPTFNHNKVSALLILMCLIIDSAINDDQYWINVGELVNSKMTGTEKTWMVNYLHERQTVLNKWNSNSEGGVKYYETMKTDGETGNEEDLY